MNITQSVQNAVAAMPAGQIFGYNTLPNYSSSPTAVVKAVNRMVKDDKLSRFAKGQFFVPKQGLVGARKPSDNELIRNCLYKKDTLRGYVTGVALYNKLGLTTQIPKTVTIAINGGRQKKDFGRLSIQLVPARTKVTEDNATLLGYLDALREIKAIPDTSVSESLQRLASLINALSNTEKRRLVDLAIDSYPAQVRALLGVISERCSLPQVKELTLSLNPTTVYKLKLDEKRWPNAKAWNIR